MLYFRIRSCCGEINSRLSYDMTMTLRFEIITEKDKAKEIWEYFSPHLKIDDEWEFRYTWIKHLDLPLHFIVGYDGDEPVGLLALEQNTNKGLGPKLLNMDEPFLEFFGGVDTDDNYIFLKPGYEHLTSEFLEQIHTPAILTSLKTEEGYATKNATPEFYLNRYEIDITGATDFDSYIDKNFSGKTRRNIKSEAKVRFKDEKVEILDGTIDDLEYLFQLSISRFGDRSSFNMEYRRKTFRDLFQNFDIDLFKVAINGEIKGIAFCNVYKERYTGINIGYDYSTPGLGKFLVVSSIPRAAKRGCTIYDAGQGDTGWKSAFHFTKISQYQLKLNTA